MTQSNSPIWLPKMQELRQEYPASPSIHIPEIIKTRFRESGALAHVRPGMRIAVGVGSRGIANLKQIVHAVLATLLEAGAKPFIVPAMGSHGGATPAGQEQVLAEYGITPDSMQVPFETSMETVPIGATREGLPVLFSRPVLQADGIIPINRIKPHTDFAGDMGSGILKMLVIGFGKREGAANAHRAAAHLGHEAILRSFANLILASAPVICGVAILENQHHETAEIDVLPANALVSEELRLFQKAKAWMPSLPFDQIDLLIVDQLGKNISGSGMDPNVVGRGVLGYVSSLSASDSFKPAIARIFVRDLTPQTEGNGAGIGMADFTTTRVVRSLNLQSTYINCLTSLSVNSAKIPIHFETDREVLDRAVASLALPPDRAPRIVRIANTLELDRMLISESAAKEAAGRPNVAISSQTREMEFDADGNLTHM